MSDNGIDDGSGSAVTAPIRITWILGKEADMVPFANNDHSDARIHAHFLAGSCENTCQYPIQIT